MDESIIREGTMPNTYFSLQAHLVFSTHGRQPWIADD